MKIFFFLFSIYMITLSCAPCSDDAVSVSVQQTVAAADNNKGDDHCEDICQPFCSCSCCASPVIDQKTATHEIQSFISVPEHSLYCNEDIPVVYFAVWQPPQLV